MTTSILNGLIGLGIVSVALSSCTRMEEDQDVSLVPSEPVSVFATEEQAMGVLTGHSLAVLAPEEKVPVLHCTVFKDYRIYRIRIPDGRTGFVSDGHYLVDAKGESYAACAKPLTPELERGWVTNCIGPAFSKFAKNGTASPGPERPVFRISDQLVLAVPEQYGPWAASLPQGPRTCTKVSDLPRVFSVQFYFQGNWSAGYKPSEVPISEASGERLQPDKVSVRVERDPQLSLSPEVRQRAEEGRGKSLQEHLEGAREIAGLTCHRDQCWYGAPGDSDFVALRYGPANASFVDIGATHRSQRYGGTLVGWNAFTSDISHWRDIDDEVWKRIADWNVVNQDEPQSSAAK